MLPGGVAVHDGPHIECDPSRVVCRLGFLVIFTSCCGHVRAPDAYDRAYGTAGNSRFIFPRCRVRGTKHESRPVCCSQCDNLPLLPSSPPTPRPQCFLHLLGQIPHVQPPPDVGASGDQGSTQARPPTHRRGQPRRGYAGGVYIDIAKNCAVYTFVPRLLSQLQQPHVCSLPVCCT